MKDIEPRYKAELLAQFAWTNVASLRRAVSREQYNIRAFTGITEVEGRIRILHQDVAALTRIAFDPRKLAGGIIVGDLSGAEATVYYAHERRERVESLTHEDFANIRRSAPSGDVYSEIARFLRLPDETIIGDQEIIDRIKSKEPYFITRLSWVTRLTMSPSDAERLMIACGQLLGIQPDEFREGISAYFYALSRPLVDSPNHIDDFPLAKKIVESS